MPGKKDVTSADISEYAIRTRTEDGSTLFQAIAEGDLPHALQIMKTISETDSGGLQRAFAAVGTRFRLLESYISLVQGGESAQDAAAKASYLSPYPESFSQGGIRKKEIPVFSRAMSVYSLEDVRAIIRYLGRMDTAMKGAGTEMEELVFSDIIYTMAVFRGREPKLDLMPPSVDIRI